MFSYFFFIKFQIVYSYNNVRPYTKFQQYFRIMTLFTLTAF